MKNKKKSRKTVIILAIILTILIAQTLPVFFPKPLFSKVLKDDLVTLYYQKGEETGAKEVFDLIREKSEMIYDQMKFESVGPIKVYIYSTQWQLAIREAGFATLIIAPPWHIGDSHNGNIMMVSPYTPVSVHTHDSILLATLHELVHSINYHINPNISYFWDNGLATYLSDQKPNENELFSMTVPSINDMHTENGLKFGEMGGYAFSYSYIDYIKKTYGWDTIINYASGNHSYEEVFNKSESEVYNDWVDYLQDLKTEFE